jgi:hypothetical protein
MSRRTIFLSVLFLLLGTGAWYAWKSKQGPKSSRVSPDMDFPVRNTDEIGKIFIADRKGQTASLVRKEGYWEYNGQYKARKSAMETLLETIQKVNVAYIPTQQSQPGMVRDLAGNGLKVEIYDRAGERLKCYYVGGVTNDEEGTIFIMEGSEKPYVCHIPGFVGTLRVRYILGDDLWRDRTVFGEDPEKIRALSIEYPRSKSESFRLEKTGAGDYSVAPLFSTTARSKTPLRKGIVEGYLLQFEQKGAESLEMENPKRDSVSALVPFALVQLTRDDGSQHFVRFWPVETVYDPAQRKTVVNRYFTDCNKGEAFLLTQHRVFAPIFRGYGFFFEGQGQALPN